MTPFPFAFDLLVLSHAKMTCYWAYGGMFEKVLYSYLITNTKLMGIKIKFPAGETYLKYFQCTQV